MGPAGSRHQAWRHILYTRLRTAIDDNGNTSRALIEVKQYRRDFTTGMAARMCTVARHYHTTDLLLYCVKSDTWYAVSRQGQRIQACPPPRPGTLLLGQLVKPRSYSTRNKYGRRYSQGILDKFLVSLGNFLFPPKPKRRRRH